MTLVYPNIVPENNLRLPDALTIKHGPARLLSTFVLEGDKAARRLGFRLRLRHDFDELVYLNKQQVSKGTWFRLVNSYNPNYTELTPENAFWISGEDEHGEIIGTYATRVYYWPTANLGKEAKTMFYGRQRSQKCIVTAPAAKLVAGVVNFGGAVWIRPDVRGRQASRLFPRIGKAYAASRWPLDWAIAYVSPSLVAKGMAAGYGHTNVSHSIFYPDSPWGDLEVVLAYTSTTELYDDLTRFIATDLSGNADRASEEESSVRIRDDRVTNVSREVVLQGSSMRS